MQMVEEVSEATAWVSANCKEYGGSPKKICLLGHSAGAQLCLMALLSLIKTAKQATETKRRLPAKVIGAVYGRSSYSLTILKGAKDFTGKRFISRVAGDEHLVFISTCLCTVSGRQLVVSLSSFIPHRHSALQSG